MKIIDRNKLMRMLFPNAIFLERPYHKENKT